ncbi:MAG: ArnT family glycosyltransferase, partial [Puniceicoccales bacterium]
GTIFDHGVSWDESMRFRSGDRKLEYYQALFAGEDLPELGNDKYPGLFDLPLAWFDEQFPELGTRHEKGHVWSLLFGLVGIFAGWRLAVLLAGERAGFWALLLLIATPRYYGHMFFNPKDTPLAAMYLLGLYALIRLLKGLPTLRPQSFVLFGVAAGLTVAVRIGGLLLLCYLGLFLGLFLVWRWVEPVWRREQPVGRLLPPTGWWSMAGKAVGLSFASALIAGVILLAFWPAAHGNPFAHASGTMESVQSFGWDGHVLFQGQHIQATELPRSYLPVWLLITTPEVILLLLLIGAVFGAKTLIADRGWLGEADPVRLLPMVALVFSFVFPIAYIVITKPVLYDGLRHALFVVAPMSIAAAISFEYLLRFLGGNQALAKYATIAKAAVGGAVVLVLVDFVTLHPYQYVYFNASSGGLRGALGQYETDYWGLSHRQAAEWLNAYVALTEGDNDEVHYIYVPYYPLMLTPFVSDRFLVTNNPAKADFFVSITRLGFHTAANGPTLYEVVRQGTPLCVVKDLRSEEDRASSY